MIIHGEHTLVFHESTFESPPLVDWATEERAEQAVNQLSGPARKIARMILEGFSMKEAAEKLKLSESTVRRILRSAGKQIR